MSIKSSDVQEYFSKILNPNLDAEGLVKTYVHYLGIMNWGVQDHFISRLQKCSDPSLKGIERHRVLGPRGEITPSFLERFTPQLWDAYFKAAETPIETKHIFFHESENEHRDERLPPPLGRNIRRADRPAFSLGFIPTCDLFVSCYGFMALSIKEGVYYPQVCSRALGQIVKYFPVLRVQTPLVVVQDEFQGDNFCHFLYDWLPRILHFLTLDLVSPKDVLFVMGGEQNPLHAMALEILKGRYGLDDRNFYFPGAHRVIFEATSGVYVFSDQLSGILHPMHFFHSKTLSLVKTFFDKKLPPALDIPSIYISRRDADLRRIANEVPLIDTLLGEGFQIIQLGHLTLNVQLSLFQNASKIVAPHGMGLTGLIFNRCSASVVELFHPRVGGDAYMFAAKAMALPYSPIIGDEVDDQKLSFNVSASDVLDALALDDV